LRIPPFAKSAKDGADTAGRTDAFTRGDRMGHPSVVGVIELKSAAIVIATVIFIDSRWRSVRRSSSLCDVADRETSLIAVGYF
jgi:hypothetical protein